MTEEKPSNEMPFGVAVIFLLVGIGLTSAGLFGWIGQSLWIRSIYRPATAVVLETRPTERPAKSGRIHGLQARLGITAGGREYRSWVTLPRESRGRDGPEAEAVRGQLVAGQRVACFHNPFRPAAGVVLERPRLEWAMIPCALFPLAFLAVGAGTVASSWRRTFPRGARAELSEVVRRLPRPFYLHLLDAAVIGAAGGIWLAGAPRGPGILGLIGAIAVVVVMVGRAIRAGAVAWPSPERLAARGRGAGHPSAGEKPARPAPRPWAQTPPLAAGRGERLSVRLRPAPEGAYPGAPAGTVGVAVVIAGLIGIAALERVSSGLVVRPGSPSRALAISTVLLAAAGAGVATWRSTARRVRGLAVEVSRHPLRAGGPVKVALLHRDPAELGRLRLTLTCLEEADTGAQRGSKHSARETSTRVVAVLEDPRSQDPAGMRRGHLDVPGHAVPSLALEHHWITWTLAVRLGGPIPWTVAFPVAVEAPAPRNDHAAADRKAGAPAVGGDGPASLWLDCDDAPPGAPLTGGYLVGPIDGRPLQSVELSVLWQTEDTGLKDRGVCHYEDRAAVDDDERPLLGSYKFHARLPDGPPSYEGSVVKIRWRARLRLRYADGGEVLRERPFSHGRAGP